MFQDWSLSYGDGMAWDAVLGQLHWSAGLLDALCPARLRPALFAAVIDLANTAGYIAMDAGADGEARRIYYARPRALCLTKLASLTMVTGDPLQAAIIGQEAWTPPT
ncbi:MAG: hypothetical protein ACRDRE_14035 [Pseudonocardiaceae bacterium]